jgi:hypothetical protein
VCLCQNGMLGGGRDGGRTLEERRRRAGGSRLGRRVRELDLWQIVVGKARYWHGWGIRFVGGRGYEGTHTTTREWEKIAKPVSTISKTISTVSSVSWENWTHI